MKQAEEMIDALQDLQSKEKTFPYKGGSGSGTESGWAVEARYNFDHPEQIGEYLLDNRWRQLRFPTNNMGLGVPCEITFHTFTNKHGLYSYQAAEALRWWLHAIAERGNKYCFETRLVKHEFKYSYEETVVSSHKLVTYDDRSSAIPDWGKKPELTKEQNETRP